jgi:hypothetical protein
MKEEKIKKFFLGSIIFVATSLIAFATVIFSQFTYESQIYYFKIGMIIFLILVLFCVAYYWYITPDFIRRIRIRMKIKKDIRELKKGREYSSLTVADVLFIFNHLVQFEDIKDFNILIKNIEKQIKQFSQYLTTNIVEGIIKSVDVKLKKP